MKTEHGISGDERHYQKKRTEDLFDGETNVNIVYNGLKVGWLSILMEID